MKNQSLNVTGGAGSTISHAIEAAWTAIAMRHPDLPLQIVAITGMGAKSYGLVRGHWAPGRWESESTPIPEVFISGERLSDGAVGLLTTLLHEAAHALAFSRGIKDTSRQHRYHNGEFVKLAGELGLDAPESPDRTIGFSNTTIRPETEHEYRDVIAMLDNAIVATIPGLDVWQDRIKFLLGWLHLCGWSTDPLAVAGSLGGMHLPKPRAPRQARTKNLQCECRIIKVPVQLDSLTCSDCSVEFEEVAA